MNAQSLNLARRQPSLLGRLIGRRYVIAWALSVGAVSLYPAMGGTVEQGAWALTVVGVTAILVAFWIIEPYVAYRYRRRRFRRALLAEGAWSAWGVHRPMTPWTPQRVGWKRLPRKLSPHRTARRPRSQAVPATRPA